MPMNTIAGIAGVAGVIQPAIQTFYDRNLLDRAIPADIHGRFGQVRLDCGLNYPRYSGCTGNCIHRHNFLLLNIKG